jgi:uncharacterized protein YndB with AHSA1/START domain
VSDEGETGPPVTVQVSRHYNAPPEKVFDAWTNPEVARKFFFATPGGEMVRAETDPRPGGKFVFTDRREDQDIEHSGEYLTVERPRRLVFRFRVPKFTKEFTTVAIDIKPNGEGCDVTLTHAGVWADYEDRTKSGWTMILNNLAKAL